MCVFQLRNHHKLIEVFGVHYYYTLIQSLAEHFSFNDEILEHYDNDHKLPVIRVESIDKSESDYFEFFVIERINFIYFLAYKTN